VSLSAWHNFRTSSACPVALAICCVGLACLGCQTPELPPISDRLPLAPYLPATPPPPQPTTLPAGPLQLSIEQAVMLALENNRGLRIEQYRPLIAGTFEELERAVYDPVLRADLAASQSRRRQSEFATGTLVDVETEQQSGSVGINQRLPTGTQIGGSVSHRREDSDRAGELHVPRVGVTLSQAILRGRNREANLAGIRQAQLQTRISQYELRGFIESLVADIERTFWSYALAQREIEIFQSSVELAEQQLREVERRIEVGAVAPTERVAGQAELAQRRENLINAQSLLAQNRLRLLRLLNIPGQRPWDRTLQPQVQIIMPELALDPVEQHVELALVMRPEISEAQLRLEQGRLDVIQTRDGLLPQLDLFLTLGKTGYASTFGDAWSELTSSNAYDLSASLAFEHPLGNRAARADYRRATLTREQLSQSILNLQELVELDVRSAYLELLRTREQVTATGATRALREETLRVEAARFQVGTSTAFIVAQAQRDLLESQIAEVRSVVNHRRALIELYRLEGSLLQRRGLDAPGAPE
jgi:outer membrane protein